MDITGKIVEISSTQQVTATFQKREFVLEYAENPQYPEFIKFELIQDKCALLDSYQVGQEIKVHFNLKGRKWTDPQGQVKYFNSLQAWRIEDGNAVLATPPANNAVATAKKSESTDDLDDIFGEAGDDDLPF